MVRLFFSYSHKDEELRNELETHLALLKRQGVIDSWHDRRITAGCDVDQSIAAELEGAHIILLLVSAYFIASDYCYQSELQRALAKHEDGSATVIPVILRPCDWVTAPFGRLRATPTDGKPVTKYADQHEAFAIITADIRQAAAKYSTNLPRGTGTPDLQTSAVQALPQDRSGNLRVKRRFDDHERDQFVDDSYEYIARYFEGSLDELTKRNSQLKTRFKRLTASSFTAHIYDTGKRVAQCAIWYGGSSFATSGIAYSSDADHPGQSYNELLSVDDDGYSLQLRPFGMRAIGSTREVRLTPQGAAELYWSMLMEPLQ